MSISDDIITKANPPTDGVRIVLQITAVLDLEELQNIKSDYDFWVMMTDFNPPVEVIDARMEVPEVKK